MLSKVTTVAMSPKPDDEDDDAEADDDDEEPRPPPETPAEERRSEDTAVAEIGATSATTTRSERIPATSALRSAGPGSDDEGGSAASEALARDRRMISPTRGMSAIGPKMEERTVHRM